LLVLRISWWTIRYAPRTTAVYYKLHHLLYADSCDLLSRDVPDDESLQDGHPRPMVGDVGSQPDHRCRWVSRAAKSCAALIDDGDACPFLHKTAGGFR